MTGTVEILTGVAGTGKTSRLLREYRAALGRSLREGRPGTTLWLAPANRARRAVLAALLDESLPVCFAPNVFTFDAFAEKILATSAERVSPLSEVAKRTLLRGIVDKLLRQQALPYFAPIAETSGFLDLLSAFVAELKRDETWPDDFTRACRSRGERSKDRELTVIYQRYQELLLRLGLYDAEGRFWSAREALKQGSRGPFEQLSHVVVDGFTDFTHTQYEILEQLAHWSDRLVISLPTESPLIRDDLFAKSSAAGDRIHRFEVPGLTGEHGATRRRGDAVTPRAVEKPSQSPRPRVPRLPAFEHIADNLFANPRQIRRLPDADGIEILAATGQLGEVETLAERVKRLLLAGVAADDVVIAFRSLDDYADLVNQVFTAAGIPFWCEAGFPLMRAPVLKALFAVLQLEREDWPFERLMGVLHSNYFRPCWNECGDGRAVREVAAQLRWWKVHSQRSAMLQTLQRCCRERPLCRSVDVCKPASGTPQKAFPTGISISKDGESPDLDPTGVSAAWALLERLSAATERLRRNTDFATWVDVLVSLAGELGIAPNRNDRPDPRNLGDSGDLFDRDLRMWERFERILFDAVKAQALLDSGGEKLSLGEFETRLKDLLRNQSIDPLGLEQGRVRVLEAAGVRNLDVPHLFLAGLSETSFPRNRGDDCLYSEAERRQLNEHGLTMGHRSSRSQDEMLLFYGVVTRARKSLVLSYPAVSAAGEPLFPSPYLTALTDLFEPDALPKGHVGQLDPVPAADRILTPADLRTVATLQVREQRPGLFRAMCETPATSAAAQCLLASVDMAVSRFQEHGFAQYEGMLCHEGTVASLKERFGPDYQFSATQLERYATCPFRFFVADILKIEPPESTETATDYRRRGILVHDVLAALHHPPADAETVPEGVSTETLAERFRELVDQQLRRRIDDTELQKALSDVERQLLADWAADYAEQWGDYVSAFDGQWDSPPVPVHLETPFGNVPELPDGREDVRLESLVLGSPRRQTRVQGRIDRVDVGTVDGRPVYNVIDYKTGKPHRFNLDDVRSGRAIQLALYTLAVRRLGLVGPDAVPFQMGYWSIRDTGFVYGLKTRGRAKLAAVETAVLESLETVLEELIPRLAAGVRGGRFPVYSQDADCTGSCPYFTVCRVNQIRPLEQTLEKRIEV